MNPAESISSGEKPRLTKEDIAHKLERGESLERLDLHDLNLAGLNFENTNFNASDVRGLSFYKETTNEAGEPTEIITNLNGTQWKDCIFSSFYKRTEFVFVNALGAKFGFTEDLVIRRQRHQEMKKDTGEDPEDIDSGAYFNFDGRSGNFEQSLWQNIYFAGNTDFPADFSHANLNQATFYKCDLSGLDLSQTKIDKIKIIDPVELSGLIIKPEQIETLARAIEFPDSADQEAFNADLAKLGAKNILEKNFGVIIHEKRN